MNRHADVRRIDLEKIRAQRFQRQEVMREPLWMGLVDIETGNEICERAQVILETTTSINGSGVMLVAMNFLPFGMGSELRVDDSGAINAVREARLVLFTHAEGDEVFAALHTVTVSRPLAASTK